MTLEKKKVYIDLDAQVSFTDVHNDCTTSFQLLFFLLALLKASCNCYSLSLIAVGLSALIWVTQSSIHLPLDASTSPMNLLTSLFEGDLLLSAPRAKAESTKQRNWVTSFSPLRLLVTHPARHRLVLQITALPHAFVMAVARRSCGDYKQQAGAAGL